MQYHSLQFGTLFTIMWSNTVPLQNYGPKSIMLNVREEKIKATISKIFSLAAPLPESGKSALFGPDFPEILTVSPAVVHYFSFFFPSHSNFSLAGCDASRLQNKLVKEWICCWWLLVLCRNQVCNTANRRVFVQHTLFTSTTKSDASDSLNNIRYHGPHNKMAVVAYQWQAY